MASSSAGRLERRAGTWRRGRRRSSSEPSDSTSGSSGRASSASLPSDSCDQVDEDRPVGQHATGDVERQHAIAVAVEQLGGDGVADVVGDDHGPLDIESLRATRSVRSAWANSE